MSGAAGRVDVVPVESLRRSATAALFEGDAHGAEVSVFVIDSMPGAGPELHVHPYVETFLLHEGRATFTVGGRQAVARAGQIVVAPAATPHRFENTGDGRLRMTCIHASPRVVQREAGAA